jgi:lipopolysaccharide export system permease protein
VVLALPLSVLLGAMSTFYAMARSHEITAIRSAGVSLKQFVVYLLPVPALFAVLQFVLAEHVVPPAETELKRWWDATTTSVSAPERRWVHVSSGPLSFDDASPDGRRLADVQIYMRGADGLFYRRISARAARWDGSRWWLEHIEDMSVSNGRYSESGEMARIWQTNLRPEDVLRLDVAQPRLSRVMLADVIAGERVGTKPLSYYLTVFYRSFTAPLGTFIMLLLAVPPARALSRGGGGGELLLALGLGLGFLLCDGLMSALGTSGRVPAAMAVATAPVLFSAIGLALLTTGGRT